MRHPTSGLFGSPGGSGLAGAADGVPGAAWPVPVEAQGRGVVTKVPTGYGELPVRQLLCDLPGAPVEAGGEHAVDVHAPGAALQVPVGDHEQPVARLQDDGVSSVGARRDAEGRPASSPPSGLRRSSAHQSVGVGRGRERERTSLPCPRAPDPQPPITSCRRVPPASRAWPSWPGPSARRPSPPSGATPASRCSRTSPSPPCARGRPAPA